MSVSCSDHAEIMLELYLYWRKQLADFSFKSVLRESRRIAVFSDLSLLLLYVCAVNLPLFCDFRRCFLWKSQCLVHWYQEATNMWQVLGSATVSSLLLWGRLNACLLVCCDLCFAFYCFFLWGLSWKRKNAMKPVCTCMFHFHLQSKEPRSHEMSAPVLGATLEVQNTMRLQRSSVTAKTMQHPLHRTEQPLRCKTQSNCADYGCSYDT